jgi:hypothetical protein
VLAGLVLLIPSRAAAQDLFEIQVYPSETMEPHHTMFEFHLNTFPKGTQDTAGGLYANNHQFHLTMEVTHGLTKNWELGGYLVSAYVPGVGAEFVGTRIRPRFQAPASWKLPFHFSLSTEVDFNRHGFDPNGVTMELRPILDKQLGKWYLSFNPAFGKSLRGPDAHAGFDFEPGLKVSFDVTKRVAAGFEYYAETGPVVHFDPLHDQHHMIFPTIDLNISPDWEFNFGVGRGLTGTSEHWIVKCIIGRRFKF